MGRVAVRLRWIQQRLNVRVFSPVSVILKLLVSTLLLTSPVATEFLICGKTQENCGGRLMETEKETQGQKGTETQGK